MTARIAIEFRPHRRGDFAVVRGDKILSRHKLEANAHAAYHAVCAIVPQRIPAARDESNEDGPEHD